MNISDKINVDNLIAEVRKLANESPDAVYKGGTLGCMYLKGKCGNGVGCIIGQAISRLYPELLPILQKADKDLARNGVGYTIGMFLGYGRYSTDFTEPKDEWLYIVQREQDHGHEWSECIKHADKVVSPNE